jgi:hypothetical protein
VEKESSLIAEYMRPKYAIVGLEEPCNFCGHRRRVPIRLTKIAAEILVS